MQGLPLIFVPGCRILFKGDDVFKTTPLCGCCARDIALQEIYDFVVVGGGTSGLITADRLTEDPNGERDRAILLSFSYTKYYWGLLMR